MMGDAGRAIAWRMTADGIVLRVRVTPKSSRDGVEGVQATAEGPAVKVRVRAVPEDGAANAAVEAVTADWLGLARRDVRLVSGAKARVKLLAIAGEQDELVRRIESALTGKD
jgi:uncharacterized protein